jgi:hypothetical protein
LSLASGGIAAYKLEMDSKLKTILMVVGVFLVGYGTLYFLNRNANRGSRTTDSIYYSMQERVLPSGRVLRKVVEERKGEWTKTAILLDRHGAIIDTKIATMSPDVCKRVENGEFVPDLWSDCSIEY